MLKQYKFLILFSILIYFFGVYRSFFTSEEAYIYDRESDRVFYLKLVPYFEKCSVWQIWLPGKKCFSDLVVDAQYLFEVNKFKDLKSLNHELEKKDPKRYFNALTEKLKKESDQALSGVKRREIKDKEYGANWDFIIADRRKIDLKDFPSVFYDLYVNVDALKNFNGGLADLVILKTNWHKPIEPEIFNVKNAIVFRGNSAKYFVSYIDPKVGTLKDYNSSLLLTAEDLKY